MIPHQVYYQLAVVGLLLLCIMLHHLWPRRDAVSPQLLPAPLPLKCKYRRPNEPTPFAGLTLRPQCAACAYDATHPEPLTPRRPVPMPPTHRRPCAIDISRHFCPHVNCSYRGCLGLGNLRANGHSVTDHGVGYVSAVTLATLRCSYGRRGVQGMGARSTATEAGASEVLPPSSCSLRAPCGVRATDPVSSDQQSGALGGRRGPHRRR
jgi:hypothetical protein